MSKMVSIRLSDDSIFMIDEIKEWYKHVSGVDYDIPTTSIIEIAIKKLHKDVVIENIKV